MACAMPHLVRRLDCVHVDSLHGMPEVSDSHCRIHYVQVLLYPLDCRTGRDRIRTGSAVSESHHGCCSASLCVGQRLCERVTCHSLGEVGSPDISFSFPTRRQVRSFGLPPRARRWARLILAALSSACITAVRKMSCVGITGNNQDGSSLCGIVRAVCACVFLTSIRCTSAFFHLTDCFRRSCENRHSLGWRGCCARLEQRDAFGIFEDESVLHCPGSLTVSSASCDLGCANANCSFAGMTALIWLLTLVRSFVSLSDWW